MHDPLTVAFNIHYPWHKRFWQTERRWLMDKSDKYHEPFITIWHLDPEKDGSDDSCGFSRPRVPQNLVEKAQEEAKSECVEYGLFPNYKPKYDPITTILGVFNIIVWRLFYKNITPKQMIQMINVCVNPVDNLQHCVHTEKLEDVQNLFFLCLRFYLRISRPWYKHPRWHIHHWRLQIHPLQNIKRRFFDRCCVCGKGFKKGESACSDWEGTKIFHDRCQDRPLFKFSPIPIPTPADRTCICQNIKENINAN